MNRHQFEELIIEVFDDPTYDSASADDVARYFKEHFGDGGLKYPTSKPGVRVFYDGNEINGCIVIGSGGATGIQKTSSLIDTDQLLICCCDTVFCLDLPSLDLRWQIRADPATCFQIFELQNDYIVHGEMKVSRISRNGDIKWQFRGADIFVSIDNDESFAINSDHILLADFCGRVYKIDFDGKEL